MNVGERIRELREWKGLSQGEIEQRTGLLRCYISRVENGHTVPAIETLQRLAKALELSLYQLLYDGEKPPPKPQHSDMDDWASAGKGKRLMVKLARTIPKLSEKDRTLLLSLASKMVAK